MSAGEACRGGAPRAGGPAARAAVGLVLILLLAAGLRLTAIGRDVPREVEVTTAPQTDAFWYLEASFAPADGSRLEPLEAYDRPLWNALASAWFALFGASFVSAHALGATLGVVEVGLTALALRPLGRRAQLLGTLFLATSYPFVGLARTPLIYTPIATLLAGVWALHGAGGAWRRAAAWLLLAVVIFVFKGVAVILAPGLLLAHAVWWRASREEGELSIDAEPAGGAGPAAGASAGAPRRGSGAGEPGRRWGRDVLTPTAWALGVCLACFVAARLDPTGTVTRNVERVNRYLAPELRDLWPAAPHALARWPGALLAFARRLLVLPWQSGMTRLAPGLIGLAAVGGARAALDRRGLSTVGRGVLVAAAGWALALFVALAVLVYRPQRFFALAGPPLAGLAGAGAAWLLEAGAASAASRPGGRGRARGALGRALVHFPLVAFAVVQALGVARDALATTLAGSRLTAILVDDGFAHAAVVGVAATVAAVATCVRSLGSRSPRGRPSRRLVLAAIVATVGLDLVRDTNYLTWGDTLYEANRVVPLVLGRGAVLAGPCASFLAAGTRGLERRRGAALRGGVLAARGIAVAESGSYTHVALDAEADRTGQFGSGLALAGEPPVLVLILDARGAPVLLYRLARAKRGGYELSPFERACELADAGDGPRARAALAALGPLPTAILAARVRALVTLGRRAEAKALLALLPRDDPDRQAIEKGVDVALRNMLDIARSELPRAEGRADRLSGGETK